jgi:hypothetical protein
VRRKIHHRDTEDTETHSGAFGRNQTKRHKRNITAEDAEIAERNTKFVTVVKAKGSVIPVY